MTRIPVCHTCLHKPVPLDAEFFCSQCRTPFQNPYPLDAQGRCAMCRNGLRGFDAAYCYGAYEGALRDLIHLYKYARIRTLALPLSDLLVAALPRDAQFDAVTPVPLHWRRQWHRGFNQAELLSREIARRSGIPAVTVLKRVRPTVAQAGLSNTARRHNVTRAFECRGGSRWVGRIEGKRILLIDDVLTTGSTAGACATALKRGGARNVSLVTIARVNRRMDGVGAGAVYSMAGSAS